LAWLSGQTLAESTQDFSLMPIVLLRSAGTPRSVVSPTWTTWKMASSGRKRASRSRLLTQESGPVKKRTPVKGVASGKKWGSAVGRGTRAVATASRSGGRPFSASSGAMASSNMSACMATLPNRPAWRR